MALNMGNFQPVQNTPQGGSFWFGRPDQNISNLTPEQQYAQYQQLQQGMQNADFGGIENAARRNFQTQTIPSIAERFTAFGNGQRSSAFQGALGSAGANLESQLGALRSQYGQQQLQTGLNPHLQYSQGSPGFFEQLPDMAMQLALAYLGGNGSWEGKGGGGGGGGQPNQPKSLLPSNAPVVEGRKGNAPGTQYYPGTNVAMGQKDLSQFATSSLGGPSSMPLQNRFGTAFSNPTTTIRSSPRSYF